MVTAERADPRVRNPGESRPLTWPDRYVIDREDREALKLWIWCTARGIAFSSTCNSRGHSYTTWRRRQQRAVLRIAMLLNLEEGLKAHEHLVTGEI